ncbi:MAG: long-chain fatty acid--CoA ligase [Deltaproteobacteria bacterium]|nr:long-chain fatty acid--CoA ligase [Deltaproteobacteria bacterium]
MKLPTDLAQRTVPSFLFDRLRGREHAPRFVVRGEVVTWAEHALTVRRIAAFLAARGLGRGDRVAVYAGNSVRAIAAIMGIQAAGATAVLIHASSTADQAQRCVRHAEASIVFVDEERRGRVRANEVVSLFSWADALLTGRAFDQGDAFEQRLASVELGDVAILLYTSGTTGEPKGVPLTHRNLVTNWAQWLEALSPSIPEGAVDALWLPVTHVFGLGEVLIGDMLAFTTHLCEPRTVVSELAHVRPSVFLGVPSAWEKIAATDADTGGRLSLCLSGGAALKREVKEWFLARGVVLLEGYGLSETSPTLTVNRPDAYRFDSVGKPLPCVEVRLGGDGEILARGPTVFGGYFRDPAATRAAFEDGWFHTGDIGRFTDDGYLQIIDRKKDILVTAGGKNVAPSAIEAAFRDDPFIDHVVVYGEGKRYLVAAVWPNHGAIDAYLDADVEDRRAARFALLQQRVARVNAQLPSHETLKRFAIVEQPLTIENGMLTATLKVRRRKIWEQLRGTFEGLYADRDRMSA